MKIIKQIVLAPLLLASCFIQGMESTTRPQKIEQVSPRDISIYKLFLCMSPSYLSCEDELKDFLFISFPHLSCEDKKQYRQVSREFRDYIDYIDLTFFGPVYDNSCTIGPVYDNSCTIGPVYDNSCTIGPVYDNSCTITTFSSETGKGTIGTHIFDLLKTAQYSIVIASDKCTNEEFLDGLLAVHSDKSLEIRIVVGEDQNTNKLLCKGKYSRITWQCIPSHSGKMHNKFIIVDGLFVITGSPNCTRAAYNNYNIESFVVIYHRFVALLYTHYYNYIVSGKDRYDNTQDEYCRVAKMMDVFNKAPNNLIKVCLAPILDIKTFIISELGASQLINISMFLVSRATIPDANDIIGNLLRMPTGTKIIIKVDEGQYNNYSYVQDALDPLVAQGQEIYKVSKNSKKRIKPLLHDKLILIQQENGTKKVFIGSAGFTTHVQDNENFENMVLLCDSKVYSDLLSHFNSIDGSRLNVTKVTRLKKFLMDY